MQVLVTYTGLNAGLCIEIPVYQARHSQELGWIP